MKYVELRGSPCEWWARTFTDGQSSTSLAKITRTLLCPWKDRETVMEEVFQSGEHLAGSGLLPVQIYICPCDKSDPETKARLDNCTYPPTWMILELAILEVEYR